MIEYDTSTYERKYYSSLARICPVDCEPFWGYINEQAHNGGEWCFHINGGKWFSTRTHELVGDKEVKLAYDEAELEYAPVASGWYKSICGGFSLLTRKVRKSFKVGICNEGWSSYRFNPNGAAMETAIRWLSLDSPVTEQISLGENLHILSEQVWIFSDKLRYLDVNIGMVNKNRIVLNDPIYQPLVQPLLGHKWQISL